MYNGKFETSTRRGKANVVGNTVYVTVDNFKTYANYKQFFCYQYNPNIVETENKTIVTTTDTVKSEVTNVNYQVKITANPSLRIRTGSSISYSQIGSYSKGSIVTIYAISNNWAKTNLGWICLDYTSKYYKPVNSTAGNYYRLKNKSYIYRNSNLTGTKYTYLAQTQIKVLSNISSTVDYVQVVQTGRKGYIDKSAYSSNTTKTITGYTSTVGQYKRLATKTTLYQNSNLTGTKYTYLALTQVKIVKNISSNIDYVYCVKTSRYAYINNRYYK